MTQVMETQKTDNVVNVVFDKDFRKQIFTNIKYYGIKRTEAQLLKDGFNTAFVKTLIKSIIGKEGW